MTDPVSEALKSTRSPDAADLNGNDEFDLVGLVPAAGFASRLGLTDGSKELLNVADPSRTDPDKANPVAGYLLEQMARAGCSRAFFIVRPGKWDIADAFAARACGLPLAYLSIRDSWGPPFTLAAAFPFAPGAAIVTGFPDILIDPPDAMAAVVARLRASQADVALATFAAEPADGCDHIDVGEDGEVINITPKENQPTWAADSKTWLLAAWRPGFTGFFEQAVDTYRAEMANAPPGSKKDLPMGSILVRALASGHRITSVHFPHGRFIDIGTPERFARVASFFAQS